MSMRAIVFLIAGAALAQTTNPRPTFEAAFIKANTGGSNGSRTNGSKGQIVMVNQTLKRLVERAYDVKPFQVTGPDWMENVRFDVTAKYPEGTKNDDRPVMLRTMLEDRFKLVAHTETRELPGYALVPAKSGLKIKPVEADKDGGTESNGTNNLETVKMTAIPLEDFADFLARRVGSAVVDRTGAAGVYSFEVRWALDDPSLSFAVGEV